MRGKIPGIEEAFQKSLDEELKDIATSGYSLILQTTGTMMGLIHTTTNPGWMKTYMANQLWVVDPVVRFAYSEVGMASFDKIREEDPLQDNYVFELCAQYGLVYGTVVAGRRCDSTKCSLVGCRPDRDFTGSENSELQRLLEDVMSHLDAKMGLSSADLMMLDLLSNGFDQETVAYRMSVSREAVKKRVDRVRRKMGARNATHAVSLALKNNLLG